MSAPEKVRIIGIGDDGFEGLTESARRLIDQADSLIGESSLLEAASSVNPQANCVDVSGDYDRMIDYINDNASQKIAILATGDPLFYGTARYLCDRLGKDRFEVTPHVSSMQLAFARVKESWDEAYLTNLDSQKLEYVVEKIRTAQTVGLFTTEEASPSDVAQALLDRRIDYFSAYVCENLGSPDERVTQGGLSDVAGQQFGPLNVMILVRKPGIPDRPVEMVGQRLFGNPDEFFLQSKPKRGLLTPSEVRSIALAELDLGPTSTVWDVGAGSGSVAIEAAQIASGGHVYAIEMDPEDYQLISANAEKFGVGNLIPILGKAPQAWDDLPDPDAIFVGGAGRQISHIVEQAFERLKPGGRIAATVGSIENVAAVRETLFSIAGDANVWMINVSRGAYQLERMRFESLNPIFLLSAIKGN